MEAQAGTPFFSEISSPFPNTVSVFPATVNTAGKSFGEKTEKITEFTDNTTDWANPQIPVVSVSLKLTPLKSRVLALVRESGSNKPLTSDRNTRVILSKDESKPKPNYYNSKAVDKYGYAEFLVDENQTKNFFIFKDDINSSDPVYFSASADGYTFGNQSSYKVVLNSL